MSPLHRRWSLLALVVGILLMVIAVLAYAGHGSPMIQAWERARAAGSYDFTSDIRQVTTPSATVTNAGRASREELLHLEGQTNPRQRTMSLRLWTGGGSVAQPESGVEVRVEGSKTYLRQGMGTWKESGDVMGAAAPAGDFMAYMAAVRDVQAHPPETRHGVAFTRYSFVLDGPTFAGYIHDQTERSLRREGQLPAGIQLEVPQYYAEMQGTGELWVDGDGLPLRQILHLQFPEQKGEAVTAEITVDFTKYGVLPAGWRGAYRAMALFADLKADPSPIATIAVWLMLAAALVRFHSSRRLQRSLPLAVVLAVVLSPLLTGIETNTFFAAQAVQAAEQEHQREQNDAARALQENLTANTFDPHQPPVAAVKADPAVATNARTATTTAAVVDNGTDTDKDGLTDFVETSVGTLPDEVDTDGDTIADALEVNGFGHAGQHWYSDPNERDSNKDTISDAQEWDFNGDGTPDDTDADGVPDLFDDDNDGDGVPDSQDLAPFISVGSGAQPGFAEINPLALTLNDLEQGVTTSVEFQVRPRNEEHLWFSQNVLDWPLDQQGQVQDKDGATYTDIAAAQGRVPDGNESNGNMKLVPMLEIRMPSATANLPSQAELTPHNIFVSDVTKPFAGKVAYVPLSIVTDGQTGARVAFNGRMRYLPGATWGAEHQVRLIWVVQALVDQCKQFADGLCTEYGALNSVQPVQVYYDAFALTGLNVREDHGTTLATIYEDPTVDTNLRDDSALWALANGLDNTFLSGRDCERQNADGTCASGNNQLDMPIAEIARRFDHTANTGVSADERLGITATNVLRVEARSYPTLDRAIASAAMTETKRVLRTFSPFWSAADAQPIRPLLMYAREDHARGLGLDAAAFGTGYIALGGSTVTVDMAPAGQPETAVDTTASLRWTPYCAESGAGGTAAWDACSQDTYWEELEARFRPVAAEPGDTPQMMTGRLTLSQLYFLALAQGTSAVVERQVGATRHVLPAPHLTYPDGELAQLARRLPIGAKGTVKGVEKLLLSFNKIANAQVKVLQQLGSRMDQVKGLALGTELSAAYNALKEYASRGWRQATAVVVGVVLVVGAIAIGLTFLIKYYLAGDSKAALAGKILIHTLIVGVTLLTAVLMPAVSFVQLAKSLVLNASMAALQAYRTASSAQSVAVGTSRMANIVGLVIGLAVTWGFFFYAMATSGAKAFSVEVNKLAAEAIAATIYLVVLAVLSATVIGLIIVGIVAVIDAVLTAVCELGVDDMRQAPGMGGACFTLGGAAVKVIAKLLYSYDLMVDTERKDMVVTGGPVAKLQDEQRGYIAGNLLDVTLPVTTTIVHKDPAGENWMHILPYLWFFSPDNLRSSSFRYSLSKDKQVISVDRDQMSSEWKDVREDHKFAATPMYRGQATNTPYTVEGLALKAGLNQTAGFYLNMGYAIPAYECWAVPNILTFFPLVLPVCYTRTMDGSDSTYIDALKFDIFPNTLDEFMALADKGDGGLRLAWDARFPSLQDADGDGLRVSAHGGLDPNDRRWDADGDGLSDVFELDRSEAGVNFSPILWDTDGDGLADAQEMQFGTSPARVDTDNDGLSDAAEVWHQVYGFNAATGKVEPQNRWEGGWTISIPSAGATSTTLRVSSDPTSPDGDGDGVSDAAEKQLAEGNAQYRLDDAGYPFHPNLANISPLAIYTSISDRDGVLGPNATLAYTTTVVQRGTPLATTVMDIAVPPELGAEVPPALLDFTTQQTQTVVQNLAVVPGATSGRVELTSSLRGRLASSTGPVWQWEPVINEAPLGGSTRPAISADVVPARPDSQSTYLLDTLVRDSSSKGDVRAYSIGPTTSNATTLDSDGGDRTSRFENANAEVRTAVANNGRALSVWEHVDNCNVITIGTLSAINRGDPYGPDLGVYFIADVSDTNPADGGYQLMWFKANIDHGNPIALSIPISYCGAGRIEVRELDNVANIYAPTAAEWQNDIDKVADITFSPETIWSNNVVQLAGNTDGGYVRADLTLTIPAKHRYDVLGAVHDSTSLSQSKSQFSLSTMAGTPSYPITVVDRRPVVASDGTNFLVAWERWNQALGGSAVMLRLFDNNGSPLTDEIFGDGANRLIALDIASVDDPGTSSHEGFVVVEKYADTTAIRGISYRPGAAPIAGQWGNNGRVNDTGLSIAGTHGKYAFVYTRDDGVSLSLNFLNSSGSGAVKRIETSGVKPHLAFHPQTSGWLLSWTLPNANTMEYQLFGEDGQPLADASALARYTWPQTLSQGVDLACPAPTSVPNVDLRFEDLPGTTTFVDASGQKHTATVASGKPAAGASGAPLAPLSDFAARFDGVDDSLTILRTVQDDLTIAFWLKTTQVAGGEGAWYQGIGLIDGEVAGTTNDFGVSLGNGKVLFGTGNPDTTIRSGFVAHGNWHFVVATRRAASGELRLYLDGNPNPVARGYGGTGPLNAPATLRIGSLATGNGFFRGSLDHIAIYETALAGDMIQSLYNREVQSYCLAAAPLAPQAGSGVAFARLRLTQPDRRGGRIDAKATQRVIVDTAAPTSTITTFKNGQYIQGTPGGTQTLIVGGNAGDATTSVVEVQVSVNNGPWTPANGAQSWTYALPVAQGVYTIRTRAEDAVGNVETVGTGTTLIVDATPPAVGFSSPGPLTLTPARRANGQWQVALGGTASDPKIGTKAGSGVLPGSVEVLLEGATGSEGNGWQPAALKGTAWTINYALATGLADPTGVYTVSVRASDRAGNPTRDTPAVTRLAMDTAGPVAELAPLDAARTIITDTLTIGGPVTDTAGLSGIAGVDLAYIPIREVVAQTGAVLKLAFDERAGSQWYADDSSQQHNAACASACPVAGVPGRIDTALEFAGKSVVSVPNTADLDVTANESLTVQAWLKPATGSTAASYVVAKRGTSGSWYGLLLRDTGRASMYVNNTALIGSTDLRDDRWHHVVGVVDRGAGKARLYVDGALQQEAAFTGSLGNTASLDIGGWTRSSGARYNGLIDQVMVFDRALIGAEVQALAANANTTWHPATLSQPGAEVNSATWTATLPATLEDQYQIDLRAVDTAGNRRVSANVWRGIVDTRAPQVVMRAEPTGANYLDASNTRRYEFIFTCAARDGYLSDESFACSNNPSIEPARLFENDPVLRTLFPDLTNRTGLVARYYRWEPTQQPVATATACDLYGHCVTVSPQVANAQAMTVKASPGAPAASLGASSLMASQAEVGLTQAAIISPSNESMLSPSGAQQVVVAAEAPRALKSVTLSLDGTEIETASFAEADALRMTQRAFVLPPVSDGKHVLVAQASDWDGQIQARTFPITVTFDTRAPGLTLDTTALDVTTSYVVGSDIMRFSGKVSDTVGLATVQISIGGSDYTDVTFANGPRGFWSTALPLANIPDDNRILVGVRAVDFAGHVTELTRTLVLDMSSANPPDTSITSTLPQFDPNHSPTISFEGIVAQGGNNIGSFHCSLDGARFTYCGTPKSYSRLSDGQHTFRVRAVDAKGFVDPYPASLTWVVDTGAPETALTEQPSNPININAGRFSFEGKDGLSGVDGFECRLDGGAFALCVPGHTYTGLADGPHTVEVRAFDRAGNRDPSPAAWTWVVDTLTPETDIRTKPLAASNTDVAVFTFDAHDIGPVATGVASLQCQLDGGGFEPCTSPVRYEFLRDGTHAFQVRAVDRATNIDPTPATYTWTIDTTLYFAVDTGKDDEHDHYYDSNDYHDDDRDDHDNYPSTRVRGIHAAKEDILALDKSGAVRLYFDGSDVRLNGFRVDGFAFLSDGSLLFSFNRKGRIAGISGFVDDEDIIRFIPKSLGDRTAGTFSLYFDGSDVGLTTVDEDVDAFTVLPDGALLVSLAGDRTSVPGIAGSVDNSDILRFKPSTLGATTAGSWEMYFDGSDMGLSTKDENIDGLSVDVDGRLLLSTSGTLEAGTFSARNEDVVIFTPATLGTDTTGSFRPRLLVDFSKLGYTGNIKGTALKP